MPIVYDNFPPKKYPIKNHSQILRDALTETELLLEGLQHFKESVGIWQIFEKMQPIDFEETYITLCKAGLLDWAETYLNIEELYKAVTGEEVNEERLLSLAKECRVDGQRVTNRWHFSNRPPPNRACKFPRHTALQIILN